MFYSREQTSGNKFRDPFVSEGSNPEQRWCLVKDEQVDRGFAASHMVHIPQDTRGIASHGLATQGYFRINYTPSSLKNGTLWPCPLTGNGNGKRGLGEVSGRFAWMKTDFCRFGVAASRLMISLS
jgi:hypothetical protein